MTSTSTTTTTARPTSSYNRVTAAPVARPVYPRITSTTSTTTTTTTSTTTTPSPVDETLEYEEENDEGQTSNKAGDAEEDPQVIKELIDLIRKVGGVEQLEKHLLRNKDGSITLKENSASGAPTTPSTISKSLYDRVLSRPGTLSSFTRNRLSVVNTQTSETTESTRSAVAGSSESGYSKYSSVLRGNSRQGPQNEGIEKLAEFDGFLKERKQYVTINRNRGASHDEQQSETDADEQREEEEEPEEVVAQLQTTRRPFSAATPSYTSLRRTRPSSTAAPAAAAEADESDERIVVKEQTQTKQYATLSRTRARTTERPTESTTVDTVATGGSIVSTGTR